MPQFKSGDLVVLKSGGPTMTIDTVNTDIFDDDKVTGLLCVWFVGDIMQRVRFDHRAVRLVVSLEELEIPPETGAGTNGAHVPVAAAAGGAAIAAGTLHPPLPVAGKATGKQSGKDAARKIVGKPASDAARETARAADPVPAPAEASPAMPQREPTSEQGADYAAVLDSMVGAMNALIDITDPTPLPPRRTRVKSTARGPARKSSTTTH